MTVECEHPAEALRWDKHRAILRCTACGRDVGRDVDPKSSKSPGPDTSALRQRRF